MGATEVRKAYEGVFAAIQLRVKFAIQEVHQVAPEWAFARTNSAGTVLIHASGETPAEANQELFGLQQASGCLEDCPLLLSTIDPPRS